jgi:rubrerythrin
MPDEVAVTQEALRLAIQMEIESRRFYLEAGKSCGNEPGKKLYASLAREEAAHRRDFEKIYEAIQSKYAWPRVGTPTRKTRKPPHISGLTPEMCGLVRPEESELEAVKTAIKMENESYDFYRKQYGHAIYLAEKEFYQSVSAAENAHRLALIDYLEFLKDPAAYFVSKEHPTLD